VSNIGRKIEADIEAALKDVYKFFESGKAKAALQQAASLVAIAAPIVQEIGMLAPNKTVSEIEAAYQKYGVPFTTTLNSSDPNSAGNALLNLATAVLAKNLPPDKAGAAVSILNTAVQLAVTAVHAG
jgi:hypothetical protein